MDDASNTAPESEYRKLPSIDRLLNNEAIVQLAIAHGQALTLQALRDMLDDARRAIACGAPAPEHEAWPVLLALRLTASDQPSLQPVINATGIIVHTNLGRAPLSDEAREAVAAVASGYSNLEYELEAGRRGSRHVHARTLLADLCGAEDALVVNNNAAAVYFVLTVFCQGQDVLISRGELVEIGGGFRIPDVLRQSGARLVEVGTTNRTHLRDFDAALTDETAAVMRAHSSNFRQIGFVTQPEPREVIDLLHERETSLNRRPLFIDDLGSGTLLDTRPYGLAAEPMVQESVAAGADLITFSGDKLLGGPQAGIIIGRAALIEELRRHPMARALRVDKVTLAALEATLRSYRRGRAESEIPVWRMISMTLEELTTRAERWRTMLAATGASVALWEGESAIGGGSLPGETLPTRLLALALPRPDWAAARLRRSDPPIVCRIQQDHLLFDPRTVGLEEEASLLAALTDVIAAVQNGELP
jgi:L-seryl-tRNA(Ser) seleniumtransferase